MIYCFFRNCCLNNTLSGHWCSGYCRDALFYLEKAAIKNSYLIEHSVETIQHGPKKNFVLFPCGHMVYGCTCDSKSKVCHLTFIIKLSLYLSNIIVEPVFSLPGRHTTECLLKAGKTYVQVRKEKKMFKKLKKQSQKALFVADSPVVLKSFPDEASIEVTPSSFEKRKYPKKKKDQKKKRESEKKNSRKEKRKSEKKRSKKKKLWKNFKGSCFLLPEKDSDQKSAPPNDRESDPLSERDCDYESFDESGYDSFDESGYSSELEDAVDKMGFRFW